MGKEPSIQEELVGREAIVGRVGSRSGDSGVTVTQDPNSNSDSTSSAVDVTEKENISG